jgi:hypothetical protein
MPVIPALGKWKQLIMSLQKLKPGWKGWCTTINPATPDVEVGGSWLEVTLGKVSMRPYLKSKLKFKKRTKN